MNEWSPQTTKAYLNLGVQSHVAVLEPALRRLCGQLAGRSALDFGCGGAELSLLLAKMGAATIACVDQHPSLIAQAQRNIEVSPYDMGRFDFQVGNENQLRSLGRYDLVLCSLMLMMCESRERLERVTRNLIDRLADAGRLVIVLTHPCFRAMPYPTFHYQMPAGFHYWSSGVAYDVVLDPPEVSEPVVITDYHWTMQDYVEAIHLADGVILQMLELPAQYGADGAAWGDPAYLVLQVQRSVRT